MIKDLYTANGELIGTAIWHKKNATVSVVYLEDVMRENVKVHFDEYEEYKADNEIYYSDELGQQSLDDLL